LLRIFDSSHSLGNIVNSFSPILFGIEQKARNRKNSRGIVVAKANAIVAMGGSPFPVINASLLGAVQGFFDITSASKSSKYQTRR
jgi:hypothetical protein